MKKFKLAFLLFLFILTGCTNIKEASYDKIIEEALNSNISLINTTRSGYKYYLPKGLRLIKHEGSNEVLSHENNVYYMYVDYISYFNQKKASYEEKTDVVYSKKIEKDSYFGYLEIKNTQNDKYFIEIMYNYAKIEVIVEKNEVQNAITYAMSILSSIEYQDTVLKSLMGDDVLKSNEIEHNIFETSGSESGYLEILEEYGQYEEKEETVDPDFIRR